MTFQLPPALEDETPESRAAWIQYHLANHIQTTTDLRHAPLEVLVGAFEQFTHSLGLPSEGDALELWHELHGKPGWAEAANWLHRFLGLWEEADARETRKAQQAYHTLLERLQKGESIKPRDDAYAFHRFYRGPRA